MSGDVGERVRPKNGAAGSVTVVDTNDGHGRRKHRRRKSRGCGTALLAILFLVIAGAGGSAFLGYRLFATSDVVLSARPIPVTVEPGWGGWRAVEALTEAGVVSPSPFWPLFLRFEAESSCLQAGDHLLPAEATPNRLFEVLCETSYAPGVRLTLIEGQNLYELADGIAESGLATRSEVLELATDSSFLDSLNISAESLDGYLAPDTYEFDTDAGAEAVLRRLADAGEALRTSLLTTPSPQLDQFSTHELLTIASIVEREATVDAERPLIARVIFNRLDRGMKLQCDPTCVYGASTYQQTPSPSLCRDPSSTHSTYVLPGLPPTPIANPRRSSIEAALHPAEDATALYFVARQDGSGRHEFAATYEEHRRNVARFLR